MIPDTHAERRGWFASNFEAVMPTDPTELAAYEQQLADEAEHGPAAGLEETA